MVPAIVKANLIMIDAGLLGYRHIDDINCQAACQALALHPPWVTSTLVLISHILNALTSQKREEKRNPFLEIATSVPVTFVWAPQVVGLTSVVNYWLMPRLVSRVFWQQDSRAFYQGNLRWL